MAVNDAGWNGQRLPYRPSPDFVPPSTLRLHRDEAVDIDPITFEVISTKLWNINEEHADTIRRVSGSPVVVLVNDFNTCIMTEDGDSFLFAPYIQYFASASEYIIKYTLENRTESIGINPGDVFIHNDPFIAGSHQQDVGVYAPVFIGDELFCWVFSSCHVRDNGGTEPGGFCVDAPDIYYDPPMVRAMKIADANGIRTDAEDTVLRMSRLPELLALDLRSQIAGANRARTRIEETVERYGAAVVKRVMRKLIEDTEASVRERLDRLPDGRWSDVVWVSGGASADRETRKQVLTLTKRGAHLEFTNEGTDPQFAALNCSFGQFRSGILCALAQLLAFDHRYCVGGFANLVDFQAEVGTISCGDRDAAFSALHAQLLTIYMATKVLSKMIYPDPELRRGVMATSAVASRGWLTTAGTDQNGLPFATLSLDEIGGFGAFTFKDGVDQGGATFWPKLEVGDCESWEQYYPVLYLYRRGALNGGHGKYRGGHGISVGWIGHGSLDQTFVAVAISPALPVQSGLSGGHWGQTGEFWAAQKTSVRANFDKGVIPGSFEELQLAEADGYFVEPNSSGTPLGEDDVVTQSLFGGGGYGDVLERDPALVQQDIDNGAVTRDAAERVYAVVFSDGGDVDEEATRVRREERRAARLAESQSPARRFEHDASSVADPHLQVAEHLAIASDDAGEHVFVCTNCGCGLGPATENYKLYCRVLTGSLTEIDPIFADDGTGLTRAVEYRSYLCSECGAVLDNELTVEGEEPVWDVEIAINVAAEAAA
jgi:N-methylhydantoinase B